MDISLISHSMLQLFSIMGLGYLLFKVGMLDKELNRKLTRILLDVTMPAFILSSVLQQTGPREMPVVLQALAATCLFYFLAPLLSLLLVKVTRVPRTQQGLYMFMYTFSNVGFMGIPVVESLFGAEGVLYAAIFNVGFNLASFTIGVIQITYGLQTEGSRIEWKKLLSPGVSFSVLALVVYIANINLPGDVVHVLDMVGGITSPLAMILVGGTLASIPVKAVFTDWRLYPFIVIKQILLPLAMWGVLYFLIRDVTLFRVMTVLLLMPVANNSVMFSLLYENDEQLAARGVFITTLASMLSVPVMLSFLV